MTVIRLSADLSPERARAIRAIAETPGLTVEEVIRRTIATERLPGGPIASSRSDDDWPGPAENVVQDFLDEGWTVADEPPPLASSLLGELGRFGFRVVQEPSESEEPVHRRSRFPASSGEDRGRHYCMECTTYCSDGAVYVVWPCRTARAVAEGRPIADPLDG